MRIRLVLAMFVVGVLGGVIRAAEVNIEEGLRTIDGVQILQAEGKPSEFYYLPTEIRFALDDKKEPAVFLLKYNLPVDTSYAVSDADGSKKMAKQGGILAMEVDYTLPPEKFQQIEKKLREQLKNEKATLALMPIDKASISLEYIDPDSKEIRCKLAPETISLSGGTFPFLIPLSKNATDIMWDAFTKPASMAIVNAKMAFEYTGYVAPLKVTVRGKWQNVYNHRSWNVNAHAGWWAFRARADVQRVFEQMQQDGTLEVKWKGAANPDVQKLVDRLTEAIIPAMFDTNFGPPPEPAKAEPAGGYFAGVSFAYKSVEKRRKGNFAFDFERKEKQPRATAIGSKFSEITQLSKQENLERHFRVVTPGDWGLVAPRVYVNADLQKYAKVGVTVRYDCSNPETAVFSTESGSKNVVPREWLPNNKLPLEKRYEYEYKIDAHLKDGAFPANAVPRAKFETEWMKSDKPFLMLSPVDWKGPQQVKLAVGPILGMTDKDAKLATVKVTWNDRGKTPASKTFVFKTGEEKSIWEAFLTFAPGTEPQYTAEVRYTDKTGELRGPFILKQGGLGADADQLQILLESFGE